MISIFIKHKYLTFLFVVGLIWIYFLNYILQIHSQTFIFPDSESYLLASENLYYFHKVDVIRPSLIAAINGFPLLFGYSIKSLFIWNTILNLIFWLAIILLIYKIIAQFTSQKIAFYLALIYLFSIGSVVLIFQILSETPFVFVLLLAVYFFQKYFDNESVKSFSLGFSLLVLSVLIKPISFGLGTIILLIFFFNLIKILWNKWSLLIYFSFAIVIFHMYSMKKVYGDFTISYIDSYTYYNYIGTRAYCLNSHTDMLICKDDRYQYFQKLSLSEGKKEAFKDAKSQIKTNTLNFIKAYGINIYINSFRGSGYFYEYKNIEKNNNFEFTKTIFRGISKLQNLFFTITGIFLSIYFLMNNRRKFDFIKMVSVMILYIFLISGISSDQGDRFHVVFYPLVVVLIAKFLKDKRGFKHYAVPLQK